MDRKTQVEMVKVLLKEIVNYDEIEELKKIAAIEKNLDELVLMQGKTKTP
jgi:hypothetical protein